MFVSIAVWFQRQNPGTSGFSFWKKSFFASIGPKKAGPGSLKMGIVFLGPCDLQLLSTAKLALHLSSFSDSLIGSFMRIDWHWSQGRRAHKIWVNVSSRLTGTINCSSINKRWKVITSSLVTDNHPQGFSQFVLGNQLMGLCETRVRFLIFPCWTPRKIPFWATRKDALLKQHTDTAETPQGHLSSELYLTVLAAHAVTLALLAINAPVSKLRSGDP